MSYDEEEYPLVFLDGDAAGQQTKGQLEEGVYQGRSENISLVTDFLSLNNSEIEDFTDTHCLAGVVTKLFRGQDDFEDIFDSTLPMVPQIKNYCQKENIALKKGWKVDLARATKRKMNVPSYINRIDEAVLERWTKLFNDWIKA